jgi:hypothetical protein
MSDSGRTARRWRWGSAQVVAAEEVRRREMARISMGKRRGAEEREKGGAGGSKRVPVQHRDCLALLFWRCWQSSRQRAAGAFNVSPPVHPFSVRHTSLQSHALLYQARGWSHVSACIQSADLVDVGVCRNTDCAVWGDECHECHLWRKCAGWGRARPACDTDDCERKPGRGGGGDAQGREHGSGLSAQVDVRLISWHAGI